MFAFLLCETFFVVTQLITSRILLTCFTSHFQVCLYYGICVLALSLASSGREFDPRTRAFSDEELKPQPMIKKSRKQVRCCQIHLSQFVCITNNNFICTELLKKIFLGCYS
jgi:hypothetical protein